MTKVSQNPFTQFSNIDKIYISRALREKYQQNHFKNEQFFQEAIQPATRIVLHRDTIT